MVDGEVVRDLVRMYLMMNKSDRWIAVRLGLSEAEVRGLRRDFGFLGELREYEGMVLEGVRGSIRLFRELVSGLVDVVGGDVGSRLKLLELLLRYGGFGRLLEGVVGVSGSELGGGEVDRVYELGIGGSVEIGE